MPMAHAPADGEYARFRQCLRWEFGFTCSFCLTHEADLAEHGVEGWALTWIEHVVPQSVDSTKAGEYENCRYSCRLCNGARRARPNVSEANERLLDPHATPWARHFLLDDSSLKARAGDVDATYTAATYQLDDPRKSQMRRHRRDTLSAALEVVAHHPGLERRLLEYATVETQPAKRALLLESVQHLALLRRQAMADLTRFAAVPSDAEDCSCDEPEALPEWLECQLVEVDRPADGG